MKAHSLLPLAGLGALILAACGSSTPSVPPMPQADRTIGVDATNELRFTPEALTVRSGDTVAFQVRNTGTIDHEFVVGDAALQQQHDQEMSQGGMGAMSMGMGTHHQGGGAVDVPAGKTAILVYTFHGPGTLLYGCHVSGHYAAGMRGTITVSA